MITLLLKFTFLYNAVTWIESAKILGMITIPAYSHQVVFQPLWRELSLRGHQVTVLTTDPIKDPELKNLTEIDLSSSYDIMERYREDTVISQGNFLKMIDLAAISILEVIDYQWSNPEVQKLINNKNEHFDLVITEMTTLPYIFAERFKCPFIGVLSVDAPNIYYELMGNPAHPVLNPDFNLAFVGKLNFIERLASVLSSVLFKDIVTRWYAEPVEMVVKKHFGEGYPPLQKIEENMSMMFINSDPIFQSIRPLVPAVIQIGGGLQRQPLKPLPKHLQEYLDSATEGFIYFSLGSSVKGKYLAERTRNIILKTFDELPYKVLWKFELEDLPGKPDNVLISKWFPQQDIFKHPNIKLFITQGGLQSIEEAIYDHVPMLGLPFFMDQPSNIKRMTHKGLGLSLDHKTLDKETFKKTILEVINNPKYRNKIKELADLASDQPMTGLEKAIWWTEYVIRHKGAKHLRSPMLDIPTYQYFLLDVIGFCAFVVFIIVFLIVAIVKLLIRFVRYVLRKTKVKSE